LRNEKGTGWKESERREVKEREGKWREMDRLRGKGKEEGEMERREKGGESEGRENFQ